MIRKESPEVNAGSMADIAFLLLIFFLVTTTLETDEGLNRCLPPDQDPPPIEIQEKNVLRVQLNDQNQLLVEGELLDLDQLREIAIAFLDNGGTAVGSKGYCDYCKGKGNLQSSDNPDSAIIYLEHTRATSYGTYVTVQNALVAAYNTLRNRESLLLHNESYEAMQMRYYDTKTTHLEKENLKDRIKGIQQLYPQKIIEPNNNTKTNVL